MGRLFFNVLAIPCVEIEDGVNLDEPSTGKSETGQLDYAAESASHDNGNGNGHAYGQSNGNNGNAYGHSNGNNGNGPKRGYGPKRGNGPKRSNNNPPHKPHAKIKKAKWF